MLPCTAVLYSQLYQLGPVEKLKAKEHPFRITKEVLRLIRGKGDKWLQPTSFFKNEQGHIFVEGRTLEKKYLQNLSGKSELDMHPVNKLQKLRMTSQKRYVRIEHLSTSNDYQFISGSDHYLLKWIE